MQLKFRLGNIDYPPPVCLRNLPLSPLNKVNQVCAMPNYDYICLDCGDEFEAFQMMSADPYKVCGKCNGRLKRKIGTGAGFVFKGAPVSETDYRLSTSYKEGEKKEKGSDKPKSEGEKQSPAKSETASDSKPAKKEKPEPKS